MDHQNVPQIIVPSGFYFAGYDFHDGMARINQNGLPVGFINSRGHVVAPDHYHYLTEFSEGLAAVLRDDGTAAYIDNSGQTVILLPNEAFGCQFRAGSRVCEGAGGGCPETTTIGSTLRHGLHRQVR